MEDLTYFSATEFSKGILEFAEKAEYAKILQAHIMTIDDTSIRHLEKEISERKWAITEFLDNSSNYESWKNLTNNNAEMLTKYVEKNYFQHEFSGTKLKSKLESDFSHSLKSHPELALTKREQSTLKHYEENLVPEDKRTFFKEFDSIVADIHNKDKCFTRNFSKMLHDLPSKMSKEVEKAAHLVRENPLLLKDNPHHYIVNRGIENPSVHSAQFKEILEEANMGDPSATSKLAKLTTSLEQMDKGSTNQKLVDTYRKMFMGEKKTSLKNDI